MQCPESLHVSPEQHWSEPPHSAPAAAQSVQRPETHVSPAQQGRVASHVSAVEPHTQVWLVGLHTPPQQGISAPQLFPMSAQVPGWQWPRTQTSDPVQMWLPLPLAAQPPQFEGSLRGSIKQFGLPSFRQVILPGSQIEVQLPSRQVHL